MDYKFYIIFFSGQSLFLKWITWRTYRDHLVTVVPIGNSTNLQLRQLTFILKHEGFNNNTLQIDTQISFFYQGIKACNGENDTKVQCTWNRDESQVGYRIKVDKITRFLTAAMLLKTCLETFRLGLPSQSSIWSFNLPSSSAQQLPSLSGCTPAWFHWTSEQLLNLQENWGWGHRATTETSSCTNSINRSHSCSKITQSKSLWDAILLSVSE